MICGKRANSKYLKHGKLDENDFARMFFRRLKTQENILSNKHSVNSITVNDITLKNFAEKLNRNRKKTWDKLTESNLTMRDELNIAINKISTLQKIENLDVGDYRGEVEHIHRKIALNRISFYEKLTNLKNIADLLFRELLVFKLDCEKV